MATRFIPILTTDGNRLTRPTDIVKHVIQHYTHAPKNINDTFSDIEISLIYDIARSEHEPNRMAELARHSIESVIGRYFPTNTVDVEARLRDSDDGYYDIVFDIVVMHEGGSYRLSENVKIDRDGNLLYEFEG